MTPQKETILLVEAEVDMARHTARLIQDFGYNVVTAHTGEAAVRIATENDAIRLILLDIDLGHGLDGPEAARQILARRHIPIVFHISPISEADTARVKAITHYGYVVKNSSGFVLKSSLEMAFELFDKHQKIVVSEEKYRRLFENSTSLIMEADADTYEVVSCNPAMARVMNTTPDAIVGQKINELLPEKIFRHRQFYGEKALNENKPQIFEDQRDGRYFLNNFIPVFSQGKRYIQTITYDITAQKKTEKELKESEKALNTVLENIPFAVFAHDLNGRFVVVNQTAAHYTGYSKAELMEMAVGDIDHGSITRNDRADIWQRMQQNEYRQFQADHFRKDGSTYPVEINATAITLRDEPIILAVVQDITERQKNEDQIKFQANLLNVVKQSVIVTDSHGDIIYANPAAENMYGWKLAEIIGAHINDITPSPATKQQAEEILKSLLKGEDWTGEFLVRDKMGKEFWVEITDSPIRTDAGELIGVIGVSSDITERKQAEQALKESEERIKRILRSSKDIIVMQDLEGKYLYYNGPDEYGLSPADVLGKTPYDFHDTQSADEMMAQVNHVVKTGASHVMEHRVTWRNETLCFLDEMHPVFNDAGKLIATTLFSKNITERKQAEQALRTAEKDWRDSFDSLQDVMMIINPDFTIENINQSGQALLGLPKAAIIGRKCHELLNRTDCPAELCPFLQTMTTRRVETTEWYAAHFGRYFSVKSSPVFDENGEIVKFVDLMRDITEMKQLQHNLEEVNATRDKFFHIISHELKNPVIAFGYAIDAVKPHFQDIGNENTAVLFHELEANYDRLQLLLENLLEWSRLQRGEIQLKPLKVELQPAVLYVWELLKQSAAQKDITLECTLDENLAVYADYDMLLFILRNLLTNAVKFTKQGGGPIRVEATVNAGGVTVAVVDSGVGMSAQKVQRLFKLDERNISTEGTAGEKGTGLGLIICHEFVARHGGDFHVQSERGQGSTFTFTLPQSDSDRQ